ncbi:MULTISPECIES: DUF1707 domain-containing protein [Actinoalloteichus]|uniref:DUF1707 family protein n=1 Tax=Actinoalloteichus fjordicus TaxID=1612552 RepID=A0AAC9LE71_9PSEU|nr:MULTISPECIES: DUF1707 domain-containing protein [Actinoalloteichus]APU16323.1 putative DUF1707 family protein [Actinoalloteichus fjordicus]APU22382.1 putative DUF1707 family protein [Actinoalloteichus sp. GBA129-24]
MASFANTNGLRIGDAERGQAMQFLGDHFAQGRLTIEEYEERIGAVTLARTRSELIVLFNDLPGTHQLAPDLTVGEPERTPAPAPTKTTGTAPSIGDSLGPFVRSAGELADSLGRSLNRAISSGDVQPAAGESPRYRVLAGVLQIVPCFGAGRFYTGHVKLGLAQFLLSFIGVGLLWSFVDGVLLLAHGGEDAERRALR